MHTSLFEAILNTNIINFIIVISTLVWIFKKCRLGDLIEKMASDIKSRVENSAKEAQDALQEYKATRKSTKDTPKLQEEIINSAKINAQNIKDEISEKTENKQRELKLGLEKTKDTLIEKYKKMTTQEIYNACIDIARDSIVEKLDSKTHKQLINLSIDELDKIESELL